MTGATKDSLWEKHKEALHSVTVKTLNPDKLLSIPQQNKNLAKSLVHLDVPPVGTTSTANEIYVLGPDHKLCFTDRLIDLKHTSDYSTYMLISPK